jgi:hypothetical protein
VRDEGRGGLKRERGRLECEKEVMEEREEAKRREEEEEEGQLSGCWQGIGARRHLRELFRFTRI